jgi:alkylation response protein AidB-like acyl-CoA dehydrogenase
MDFSYSPRQQEVKAAARSLYSVIEKYELDCEQNNGLPPEAHRHVTEEVLAHGLQAINMPTEWGGAGLTITDQVIVQEELGKLTARCGTWSGAPRTRCASARRSNASAICFRPSGASGATATRSRNGTPAPTRRTC